MGQLSAASVYRSRSDETSIAGAATPSRLVTWLPSRSSVVSNSPYSWRLARLWWIWRATVLLPEPIVPKLNWRVAMPTVDPIRRTPAH